MFTVFLLRTMRLLLLEKDVELKGYEEGKASTQSSPHYSQPCVSAARDEDFYGRSSQFVVPVLSPLKDRVLKPARGGCDETYSPVILHLQVAFQVCFSLNHR